MAIKKKAGRLSPVLMGDYDNTTVYRRLDWVKYGGTSYICKKNNTIGIAPSDPERWQKIIDEANLNIPNYWQITSRNGKGSFVQVGTTWIVTVPTMSQPSDAATAYWGVKLATETEYTIQFGISNGTNDDSMYVNVSDTEGSHYQFSQIGNGYITKEVRLPRDAWVWLKFQHYSTNTDACAFLILEPITMLDNRRISFNEASTRQNISSTDNISTILGKIKKYFSDLKTVAFTGKYTDLSDKPTSLKNPKSLKFTGGVTAEYDGSTEKSITIPTSLKNPNTLNIKFNGTSQASYDGSATKEVNVTPAAINAVNTSTVLTTKEQISANTNAANVTGALAAKAIMADIAQLSSKLTNDVNNINSRIDTSVRKVSINNLLGELSLNSESGVVDFFNKLPTGIYFGEFVNSQLDSPSTATYNSYFAFKVLANFGKIFVMPTYSDTIYMADAQSGSWTQLN